MVKAIKDKMSMDLQYFAEGSDGADGSDGSDGSANPDGADGADGSDGSEGNTTFDQSEVDRRISKAVESAVNKQKTKWDEEKTIEIEEVKRNAQEYSQLTEKEKIEKELEGRENTIKAKEEELRLNSLKGDIELDLKENGLPVGLSSVLSKSGSPEEIKAMVKDLKVEFDKAVNVVVNEKLTHTVPSGSGGMKRNSKDAVSIRDKANQSRLIKK